jgi:hypothetical protein
MLIFLLELIDHFRQLCLKIPLFLNLAIDLLYIFGVSLKIDIVGISIKVSHEILSLILHSLTLVNYFL